jgi:hypothetical protein
MTKKQKLELTWIGKENRPKLEPRILLEVPDKSYHAKFRVKEQPQENAKNTKEDSDSLRSLRSFAARNRIILATKERKEHKDAEIKTCRITSGPLLRSLRSFAARNRIILATKERKEHKDAEIKTCRITSGPLLRSLRSFAAKYN